MGGYSGRGWRASPLWRFPSPHHSTGVVYTGYYGYYRVDDATEAAGLSWAVSDWPHHLWMDSPAWVLPSTALMQAVIHPTLFSNQNHLKSIQIHSV